MTRFSFIVPVYNIKQIYLEQCIKSILAQEEKNFEILLVDDGSTNGAEKWCDDFAERYGNYLRVVHKENGGVSTARNLGIDSARGEYLIFVDPDDWVSEELCLQIDNVLKTYDFDILFFSYYIEYKNKTVTSELLKQGKLHILSENERMELVQNLIDTTRKLQYKYFESSIFGSVWGKCFKKNFLVENKIYFKKELIKAQDTVFNLEAFYIADRVAELKMNLYHYRMVSTSVTHKYNKNMLNIQMSFLMAVENFINKNRLSDVYQEAFMHRCISSYFSILSLDIFSPYNKGQTKRKKEKWQSFTKTHYIKNLSSKCLEKYSWRTRILLRATQLQLFYIVDLIYVMKNFNYKNNSKNEYYLFE